MTEGTLRERKQRRARGQIVEAAFALFAEHGFAQVSVSDIAARAEVGRTTFFRYFGDKQEVVFADEQAFLEALESAPGPEEGPASLAQALRRLWDLVAPLAVLLIGDPARYPVREDLIAANPELGDRSNRKLDRVTAALSARLEREGADAEVAGLAAELAVACFRAARRRAGRDPEALMPAMQDAVTRLVVMV